MKKALAAILICLQLLINVYLFLRIEKLDYDVDAMYAGINTKVIDVLNKERAAIIFMRSEITDIMVELTRKGYLDPLPPEATPSPQPTPDADPGDQAEHNSEGV